uniref:Cuticle-degrading protease (PR1)) n=1 Tax=Ganoderma boninense TaxID=34458 RepID=A0A5K1JXA1_9APHY|nr:Cuticle-degrading protease (EC (Chymoelastase) (PR1) [Ganoderma boninense]
MQLFAAVATAFAIFSAASAAPTAQLKTVEKYAGSIKPSSYIIKLKDGVSKDAHLAWLAETVGASATVTHAEWAADVVNGFAGTFDSDALNTLRASSDVESITEDGIVTIAATQTDATWGLQRINQAAKLTDQNTSDLAFTYTYDDSAGEGVDIYVVDTGIFTNHVGIVFVTYVPLAAQSNIRNSPSSRVVPCGVPPSVVMLGTVAGVTYGVAKKANLFAVKVLSDAGSGFVSDIVSALSWVSQQVTASGRPSIATMSLSGGASQTFDDAVASLTAQGIHVTVAAGNNNADASSFSPARAPSAITVGASTIADARASFSNFGSIVDIFAPGQNVISAWIGGVNNTNNISGTSMATPHIAGLVATIIGRDGNSSPANISTVIQTLSTKGELTGIPSGTVNDLARTES